MKKFQDFDDNFDEQPSEPQTMSLMGGIVNGGNLPGSDTYSSDGEADKRKLAQQSFLIAATVSVIAFAALMGMRMTQKDITASAASAETQTFMANLDARLAKLDNMDRNDALNPDNITALFRDTAAIVAAIEDDPTQKQVPLEQVKMNPFTSLVTATVEVQDTAAQVEAQRTLRLQALYGELAQVRVQSLVGGARPRAFINGELYKVGDTFGSFTIAAIDNRLVAFTATDFELRDGEADFILGMNSN